MKVAGEVEQYVLRLADRLRLVFGAVADPDQVENAVLRAVSPGELGGMFVTRPVSCGG
jgi:hypothetical protein